MKNLAAKRVGKYGMTQEQLAKVAYQVWQTPGGAFTYYVLKMNQADDSKPYASWFVGVSSPFTHGVDFGDNYVKDVKRGAVKVANRMPELVAAAKAAAS